MRQAEMNLSAESRFALPKTCHFRGVDGETDSRPGPLCVFTVARRVAPERSLCIPFLAFALIGASAAWGQESARGRTGSRDSGAYPRLPGAVSKPPSWLGAEAPFDVAKLFAAPPRDRNAAPLYLDALFEFGSQIADCYPESPERDRRRQAAMDRGKRYLDVVQRMSNDANAGVPLETIDEIIGLYNVGFRKLALAQGRDQCVFEGGIGIDAKTPHSDTARQVARIAVLRVQRAVQRTDFDGAIRDVETLLRLVRDLERRGSVMTQLICSAVQQVVGFSMVPAILSSPKLDAKHCDGLLKLFLTHDQKSIDGSAEGLRTDYVAVRATLRDLVLHQRDVAARLKLKPGESVVRGFMKTVSGGRDIGDIVPQDIDAQLARTTRAELARCERDISRHYQTLLSFAGLPAAEVLSRFKSTKRLGGSSPLYLVAGLLAQGPESLEPFVRGTSRSITTIRAIECLVALRRWQLTHRGLPRSLLIAVKDAGQKSVPIDPYDGKPMRLVMIGGEPVVYSVGRDGKDDGGKDSKYDMQPGDLPYRLPAIEERRKIRAG